MDEAGLGEDSSARACGEPMYRADESAVCVSMPVLGEACEHHGCPEALCDLGRPPPVCVASGEVGLGGECVQQSDCADANVCDLDAGRCVVATASGGACAGVDELCAAGLGCDLGQSRCVEWRRAGLACDASAPCEASLLCLRTTADATSGLCASPRGEGEACIEAQDCWPALTCLAAGDGRALCATPPVDGTACDPDLVASCGDASNCVRDPETGAGACFGQIPTGMPCRVGDVCADAGACGRNGPESWACGPLGREGDACFSDADWGSALVCRGAGADGTTAGTCVGSRG